MAEGGQGEPSGHELSSKSGEKPGGERARPTTALVTRERSERGRARAPARAFLPASGTRERSERGGARAPARACLRVCV